MHQGGATTDSKPSRHATPNKSHILGLNGDSLSVDCTELRILDQATLVCFPGLSQASIADDWE